MVKMNTAKLAEIKKAQLHGEPVRYRGYTLYRQLGDDGREIGRTGKWVISPPRDAEHSLDGSMVASTLDEGIQMIDAGEDE